MGGVGRGARLLRLVEFAALLAAGSGQTGDRVGACVGSNRENCIDMERCSVNIEGSTYDISSLRRAGGSTADAASGPFAPPPCSPWRRVSSCARLLLRTPQEMATTITR
jgi:hypothetical protein